MFTVKLLSAGNLPGDLPRSVDWYYKDAHACKIVSSQSETNIERERKE